MADGEHSLLLRSSLSTSTIISLEAQLMGNGGWITWDEMMEGLDVSVEERGRYSDHMGGGGRAYSPSDSSILLLTVDSSPPLSSISVLWSSLRGGKEEVDVDVEVWCESMNDGGRDCSSISTSLSTPSPSFTTINPLHSLHEEGRVTETISLVPGDNYTFTARSYDNGSHTSNY